jgi:putative oxidoreductase
MNITNDIDRWSERHHPLVLEYLRMALGIFIFAKGVMFLSDYGEIQALLARSRFEGYAMGMEHLIAFAHLAGGPMIAMGLKTRFAAIVQIPILLGAVFFTSFGKGLYTENYHLVESIITLMLLIFYAFYGSGRLSADHKLRDNKRDMLY